MSLKIEGYTGRVDGCAAGLSAATLSAWRDGVLAPAESATVRRHCAECVACRARLERYAAIALDLRSVATPSPIGGYGRNPRLRPPIPRASRRLAVLPDLVGRSWPARVGWLGAAAAALVVIAVLVQWLRPLAAQRPLAWQARAPLPSAINLTTPTGDVVLAPSDGTSGYACAASDDAAGGTKIRVWRTHDQAATWTPIFSTPSMPGGAACLLAVDAGDALTVVVAAVPFAGSTTPPLSFATHDGGATWRPLPGGPVIHQLASARGVTYALLGTPGGRTRLMASRDGLASWAPVDQPIAQATAPQRPRSFWLDPATGNLLVATEDLPSGNQRLWSSADTGQHWTEVNQAVQVGGFVARPAAAGQGWHICAASYDPTHAPTPNSLMCSDDGGSHWAARPALNAPASSGGGHATAIPPAVFAMTSGGALLALAPTGAGGRPMLYRLAPGASQWQAQGAVPEPVVFYAAGGSGVLWALPSAIAFDPLRRVFTASSP